MEIMYKIFEDIDPGVPITLDEGWTMIGTPELEYEVDNQGRETGRIHLHAMLQRTTNTGFRPQKLPRLLDRN